MKPHAVLGVDKNATEEEIERAYRDRVKDAHPDQGGSDEEFKRVREAYERLLGEYDEGGETDGGAGTAPTQPPQAEVEYLDYEVVADHDWALEADGLFERAREAELADGEHGRFTVEVGETLLEAAERNGHRWPFACRDRACANCAVLVADGEMSIPSNHVLTEEMVDTGFRLSCVGAPVTGDCRIVFNVKYVPELDDLRLPPRPFNNQYG